MSHPKSVTCPCSLEAPRMRLESGALAKFGSHPAYQCAEGHVSVLDTRPGLERLLSASPCGPGGCNGRCDYVPDEYRS